MILPNSSETEAGNMTDYERIARAISFIQTRASEQPALSEIAAHVDMSPYHFQRLFSRWAGVSPKRFLQVLTLEHGKRLLHNQSILDVSNEIGLSSGSRLYDHFVKLEAVTPGDYRRKGEDLQIEYGTHATQFGQMFVAASSRGVCRAAFLEFTNLTQQLAELQNEWPLADLSRNQTTTARIVKAMFGKPRNAPQPLSLYVQGTNFQIAVWRALLRIPPGQVVNYGDLATALQRPRSARAVGNAIAANPVAYLIPCHRVIRQSGAIGKYHWGSSRKELLQVWERGRQLKV